MNGRGEDQVDLDRLRSMMLEKGVRQLLFKELAPNDNSKNQIYLGGNLDVVNVLPMDSVHSEKGKGGDERLKARVPFSWLRSDGTVVAASGTQLILYPQYPEARLSGFLRGVEGGPNQIMTGREAGRLLFFGITNNREVIGWAATRESGLARQVRSLGELPATGVFRHVPLGTADTARELLFSRLREIHERAWIDSVRLTGSGDLVPCKSSNCGGYTLEAQLGIQPNGRAEPDFEGWEIKSHSVTTFGQLESGVLTLMTPEPTGGLYKTRGAEVFVRKYGYKDRTGKLDRLNFSSPHRFGVQNTHTGLTLELRGFDAAKGRIVNPDGGISLRDKKGADAATWHFTGLLEHWNRKHAKAAYVPYMLRRAPSQQYSYGRVVRLGLNTDFIKFLQCIADQSVIYDPGIKVERASSPKPAVKRRSQFRIRSNSLARLYASFETVDVAS